MKRLIILPLILMLFATKVHSQDPELEYYKGKEIKTLLGKNLPGGSFGAITLGYSLIDNKNAVLIGARISGIASHFIGVGIGGQVFINENHHDVVLNRDVHFAGGYGGVYIEPIVIPNFPVHLSFPVLFGGGAISSFSGDPDSNRSEIKDTRVFLLAEPSAELELNVTRHFRLAFGVSYRFPTGFNVGNNSSPSASVGSLRGASYKLTFKFGKF
jgi:hypothetical protein